MPEPRRDAPTMTGQGELTDRLRDTPGLAELVAEAEATWRSRADQGTGWHAFEDAFPTFWEFSNRPR